MRTAIRFAAPLIVLAGLLPAATLEKLSLDDMILKSTEIVRGKVMSQTPVKRGSVIYTETVVQVAQRWKGSTANTITIYLAGGSIGKVKQHFPGTPDLKTGTEYMMFLWTGTSGATQIIGLSQGLFELDYAKGQATAQRNGSRETMIDPSTGRVIADEAVVLTLSQMSSRIQQLLGGAK